LISGVKAFPTATIAIMITNAQRTIAVEKNARLLVVAGPGGGENAVADAGKEEGGARPIQVMETIGFVAATGATTITTAGFVEEAGVGGRVVGATADTSVRLHAVVAGWVSSTPCVT
jgi:hypothetical protein